MQNKKIPIPIKTHTTLNTKQSLINFSRNYAKQVKKVLQKLFGQQRAQQQQQKKQGIAIIFPQHTKQAAHSYEFLEANISKIFKTPRNKVAAPSIHSQFRNVSSLVPAARQVE
jgi:hypothetical protein